jgi:GDPmannose 4,6-dehydratase
MNNIKETYHGKKIDHMDILNIEDAKKFLGNKKCVIVTGVTGQDGSYMADFLLENTDYIVFGGVRRLSVYNHTNISHINSDKFKLINFDLTDSHSINRIIEKLSPEYFINFAAQSFVGSSWDFPQQTWETNTTSVIHILEAIRLYNPSCRFYQAGSSEEFGDVIYSPQDLKHPLRPRSPYGASKAAARQIVKVWRDSYDIFAIQGFLFNHESERRGEEFVSRKITKAVAKIAKSIHQGDANFEPLELGNLDAQRDWSHAEDFVRAVWLMLKQDKPKDYLLASGETHTVREFVELAFDNAGIQGYWSGEGVNEVYKLRGEVPVDITLLKINEKFYRPAEVELLLGDPSEAQKELNWEKTVDFPDLVRRMCENDFKEINAT